MPPCANFLPHITSSAAYGMSSLSCTDRRDARYSCPTLSRTRECCEIRGVPLEPTACTTLDESNVIYGGEGKLLEAVKEAYAKYHPDLIVILSCCCSGIIGDDVESIAREAEKLVGCRVLALRSEGFGGDFRSGYEDAFRLIMDLMEPPRRR